MRNLITGIDPGLNGGWASIEVSTGLIQFGPMPVSGGVIDIGMIKNILNQSILVAIEKVHAMPKQGVSSTFKFGTGFGQLLGGCQALLVPYDLVTPQAWKRSILSGTNKDKDAAIAYVRRKHPDLDITRGRNKRPHDGIADAICIMEWSVIKHG